MPTKKICITSALALICFLYHSGLQAQVFTRESSNGSQGIRIEDPEGIRSYTVFHGTKTDSVIFKEDPVPGSCPTTYEKDPVPGVKNGYYLLYRDCAEGPGNKTEVKLSFYRDPARVDTWVQMPTTTIPAPKKRCSLSLLDFRRHSSFDCAVLSFQKKAMRDPTPREPSSRAQSPCLPSSRAHVSLKKIFRMQGMKGEGSPEIESVTNKKEEIGTEGSPESIRQGC